MKNIYLKALKQTVSLVLLFATVLIGSLGLILGAFYLAQENIGNGLYGIGAVAIGLMLIMTYQIQLEDLKKEAVLVKPRKRK